MCFVCIRSEVWGWFSICKSRGFNSPNHQSKEQFTKLSPLGTCKRDIPLCKFALLGSMLPQVWVAHIWVARLPLRKQLKVGNQVGDLKAKGTKHNDPHVGVTRCSHQIHRDEDEDEDCASSRCCARCSSACALRQASQRHVGSGKALLSVGWRGIFCGGQLCCCMCFFEHDSPHLNSGIRKFQYDSNTWGKGIFKQKAFIVVSSVYLHVSYELGFMGL